MLTLCMAPNPAPASHQTLFGPPPAREAPSPPTPPRPVPRGFQRGARGPRGHSPLRLTQSYQHLLTAARGTALAPGHRWAWWSRGPPILLGRLRLWHLPQEGLKQTLRAVHLQPLGGLACTSGALGVGARGYVGPSGRGRPRQGQRGSSPSHCPDSAGWASARDTQQGRPPWVAWVPSSYSHSSPHGQPRPEQLRPPPCPASCRLPQGRAFSHRGSSSSDLPPAGPGASPQDPACGAH